MNRLLTVAGLLAALTAAALRPNPVDAQGEKPPTVKEIMGKLNKGPNSLTPMIGKDLRDNPPDWDHIQKDAKTFVTLAAALQKNRPPKGDAGSWEKLAKTYTDNARALEDAAEKKDPKAAQTAIARLADMKSCGACHAAHRN